LPVEHYENFPVASWLLPAAVREPIEAIYGFARGADDVADEGSWPDAQRLARLDEYLRALDAIDTGRDPGERFARIARAVRDHALPTRLLRDLIDAFKQDVVKKRYATYAQLLDYSRRSADPIGRLVLHVFERTTPGASYSREHSDCICSALQQINFWQDVPVDWHKGRVYVPQEDLARFGVAEEAIAAARADERWCELMAFECERSRRLLMEGSPLARTLPGRLGLEIRATIAGGAMILDKIEDANGDVFRRRPKLKKLDWLKIMGAMVSGTHGKRGT
jgi:squalene synthase HpnC